MKKLIALALTAVMLFSLGLAVFADEIPSPEPPKENVVTDTPDTVEITPDPDNPDQFVVVIPIPDGYDHVNPIIKGDYEIVSGDPSTGRFVIRPLNGSTVTISYTLPSKDEFKVTAAEGTEGGTASVVKNADGTWTLKANTKSGYAFTKWTLTGKYEIVSGSEKSATLTIKISSDVKAVAYWNSSKGPSSPQTGYPVAAIMALIVVSVVGTAYAFKKFENA